MNDEPEYEPQGTARYGQFYWCVKSKLSKSGEIYVMADEVVIGPDGILSFYNNKYEKHQLNLAFAPGQWTACFAASLIDGHAVAIEHWEGEVVR